MMEGMRAVGFCRNATKMAANKARLRAARRTPCPLRVKQRPILTRRPQWRAAAPLAAAPRRPNGKKTAV